MDVQRCPWAGDDPLMQRYHDEEWGAPVHDDRLLLEFLVLEGAQAGLSWRTVLHKREGYRRAFDGFDPAKVAAYGPADVARLLTDAGIVRNAAKICSAITNAQLVLEAQREAGSFDRYIWGFTNGQTLRRPGGVSNEQIPATSADSDVMARDLKRRGFKFVGSTICYAFMQAVGMVDDHVTGCFRAPGRALDPLAGPHGSDSASRP